MFSTTKNLQVFTCAQADVSPIFAGAAILLAILIFIFSCSTKKSPPAADFKPFEFNGFVPLGYVNESIRLSEQRMAEFILSIQSFEKKALAVIAGAVALIGFVSAKEWCDDITTPPATLSILLSVCATFSAGFIITTADVGIGGSTPNFTIEYYYNYLKALKYKDVPEEEQRQAEISYLLLTVLEDYESAMQKTRQASEDKARKFSHAANFLLAAFCSALAWLLIKLGAVYF